MVEVMVVVQSVGELGVTPSAVGLQAATSGRLPPMLETLQSSSLKPP